MKIKDIKPYENNAKKHPEKQLKQIARSLKRFGWRQPIVVDKNNVIIVGHGRYEAYLKYPDGIKEPRIEKADDLTNEEVNAYRIADNKLNESEWDMKLVLPDLKLLSPEMFALTGFNPDILISKDETEDDIPEDVPARSKIGDLYQLGDHFVLCGDCTKDEDVKKLMGGVRADLIFTDPPYNVDYSGMQNSKKWNKIANDAMSPELFKKFLVTVFRNYFYNSKEDAAIYICHADKSHKEFRDAFEEIGYIWRATIIWVKNSPAFNFAQYKYSHEPIFYCFKKDQTVKWLGDNKNRTVWEQQWDDRKIIKWFKEQIKTDREKAKSTIWEAKKEHGKHPTIKPVELIQKALMNSSEQGDIVIDFFGGSGSTLITCEKMKRVCRTMELSPTYVDVIVQRYVDYVDNPMVKCNGKDVTHLWNKIQKIPK